MFGFLLVMPLVIIIAMGNILKRRGFYSAADIAALSKTLYWVILPLLLFRTTYISGTEVLTQPNLLISVNVCYIATIALSWGGAAFFAHKGDIRRVAVSVFSDFRSNNIYLGFPVVQLAMGEAGLHLASIYIAVSTIFFQVLSIGAGELALNGRLSLTSLASMCRRLGKNPLVLSCVAGVLAALAHVPIHFVLDETMKLVSGAATAVALLALGGTLDIPRMGRVFEIIRRTWFDIIIKPAHHVGRAAALPRRRGPSPGHGHAQLDALRRQLLHNREGHGHGRRIRGGPRRLDDAARNTLHPRVGLRARHSLTPRAANP